MKQINMMDEVYGKKEAEKVANLLMYLDPKLHEVVESVAYNLFWGFPELPLKEKSLVTVSSLIAMGQSREIGIHVRGFLHLKGTPDELLAMVVLIKHDKKNILANEALRIIADTTFELTGKQIDLSKAIDVDKILTTREKLLIRVASASAIKDRALLEQAIFDSLPYDMTDTLRHVFIHQAMYCGFPLVMGSFSVYREVLERSH